MGEKDAAECVMLETSKPPAEEEKHNGEYQVPWRLLKENSDAPMRITQPRVWREMDSQN